MTFIDYVEKVIIMEYLKKWENYCIIWLDLSKCIVFSSLLKQCCLVIGVREYKSVSIFLPQVKYMFSLFPISQHKCTKKKKTKTKNENKTKKKTEKGCALLKVIPQYCTVHPVLRQKKQVIRRLSARAFRDSVLFSNK